MEETVGKPKVVGEERGRETVCQKGGVQVMMTGEKRFDQGTGNHSLRWWSLSERY